MVRLQTMAYPHLQVGEPHHHAELLQQRVLQCHPEYLVCPTKERNLCSFYATCHCGGDDQHQMHCERGEQNEDWDYDSCDGYGDDDCDD